MGSSEEREPRMPPHNIQNPSSCRKILGKVLISFYFRHIPKIDGDERSDKSLETCLYFSTMNGTSTESWGGHLEFHETNPTVSGDIYTNT